MHTVEMLEEAIALAQRGGYQVRHEWLGGAAGGACEVSGRKWLFLDLASGPADQLDLVVEALRREPRLLALPMSRQLRDLLSVRKSA